MCIRSLLLKEKALIEKTAAATATSSGSGSGNSSGGGGSVVAKPEFTRLQSIVAQLRKAANHPYLFPGAAAVTPTEKYPTLTAAIVQPTV